MNETIYYAFNQTVKDEYYDEDFPDGNFMDFTQEFHKELFSMRVYNESIMRKILKDENNPLTKAAHVLYDRQKTFG